MKEQKDMTLEARVSVEIERINGILCDYNVSENKRNALASIIENTAWMKIKLDDARAAVKTSSVVIPYDNGGGQTGIRENPIFKGYESLWKSYMGGMCKILECLPSEQAQATADTAESPKTVLELVRNKHRKKEA